MPTVAAAWRIAVLARADYLLSAKAGASGMVFGLLGGWAVLKRRFREQPP